MLGQDDMKAGLLQELIEKLMEMKEGGGGDEHAKPDASIAMLDIKKDPSQDADDDSQPLGKEDPKAALLDAAQDEKSGDDPSLMKKPLGDDDFQMLRRKYKLGM